MPLRKSCQVNLYEAQCNTQPRFNVNQYNGAPDERGPGSAMGLHAIVIIQLRALASR
jgi:hypothetical protein